jgi:hypothetical protein
MKDEKIPAAASGNLLPPYRRRKEMEKLLDRMTIDEIRSLTRDFFGKSPAGKNKAELINASADLFAFPKAEDFDRWFSSFPEISREILRWIIFEEYVPLSAVEKKYGITLIRENKRSYYWDDRFLLKEEYRLNFVHAFALHNQTILCLPSLPRMAIQPWLAPPPELTIPGCRLDPSGVPGGWDNSPGIAESFPLLCDALKTLMEGMAKPDQDKAVRGGFKKRDIHELRNSSGFPAFPQEDAPDSAELAARFVLCMKNFKPQRPADGQDGVRKMAEDFFSGTSLYAGLWNAPDRNFLEFNLFLDHLSRNPGYYLENSSRLPPSRQVFHHILLEIARDGGPFDADKLAAYILGTWQPFVFCDEAIERSLKTRADSLTAAGVTYKDDYYEDYHPVGPLRFALLVKPVFKAYCYLFAALGILEITCEAPPPARNRKGKTGPVSPYDSLKTLKITGFGLWCLGLSDKRPPRPKREYEAIADKELCLVTVRGNSLERTVYLDKIGQKLGEDRWRISPASFIQGCEDRKQIENRIGRFKDLIDPEPAPHWEELFRLVVSRAGLFDLRRTDALVYSLPEDRALAEELLEDPELKGIVLRAEGRLLVVPAKNQRKFFARLNEHGIAHFV